MDRIDELSQEAFRLAAARWERGEALDDAELARAREIQAELRSQADRLRRERPREFRTVSTSVSEGLLDCKYAIEAPKGVSLRLNQHIEGMTARAEATRRATEEE